MTGLMRGLVIRLAFIVVFAVLIFLGYFALSTALDAPTKQAQGVAVQRYGDVAVKLCQLKTDSVSIGKAAPPKGAKLGVINVSDSTPFEQYNSALPTARQANSPSETAVILCLQESNTDLQADTYGSTTSSTKYYCYRKSRDLTAVLVDVKSGTPFAKQDFNGDEPTDSACPEKTDKDLTVFGDLPSPTDVVRWVIQKTGG